MPLQTSPLALAAALALGTPVLPALAQMSDESSEKSTTAPLGEVTVRAIPEQVDRVTAPVSVIDGGQVTERGASTLGEAIADLPGVRQDTFGAGASRPVIRGQTAPRVKVLSDGASVLDASDISPDHAVTVDPLLTQRIEVLRGPAALLYGGGAVGGVVNVIDGKVPTRLPDNGLAGRITLRGASASREKAGAAAVDKQLGEHLVLHAEGSWRNAADYRAPGHGRVGATWSESRNGALGASWVTPRGYFGMAYSHRDDDYGLAGHSHEYESCHPHGSTLHCGGHDHDHRHDHDHDHAHDHDHDHDHDDAYIALRSRRLDVRGEYREPFAGFSRIRFRGSHTDYRHHELDHGEIGTTFSDRGYEGRVELEHRPVGDFRGVVGLQHSDVRSNASGVEGFLPETDTRATGLFVVENYDPSEQWHFEAGARHDWLRHQPRGDERGRPGYSSTATSLSGAATWRFRPGWAAGLSLAQSERLPHAQELYARGVHLATNTYECGLLPSALTCGGAENDATLHKERSRNVGLSLRKTRGPVSFNVGAYYNRINNYIFANTLDQFEDFRLIKYSQRDASFRGLEGEVTWQLNRNWAVTGFGDVVRARFSGGDNVPRIPAARYGARVNYARGQFSGGMELYRVTRQNKLARFETTTPGHTMLNASLSYWLPGDRTNVFVRGSNLLNQQVWNHASYLAHVTPLPGRSVVVGMTHRF